MKHPFHIVDPSPWPFTGAVSLLFLLGGISAYLKRRDWLLGTLGLTRLLITVVQWWRDVGRESTFQGKHSVKVMNSIGLGMILFIIREVCLFSTFFWAFLHSSLRPNVEVGHWPPAGVCPIQPFSLPLLNTILLLSRGCTITWAHCALLNSDPLERWWGFFSTISLGFSFVLIQVQEYVSCPFTISDSVFGSTFFLTTGFHGAHVIVGAIFIATMWWRLSKSHFSSTHHLGFEARAWYWHFVDVIWLFLFLIMYWWGY